MPDAKTISGASSEAAELRAGPSGNLPVPIPAPPPKKKPKHRLGLTLVVIVLAGAAIGGGYWWWQHLQGGLPAGFASGNGRLEAEQVQIATKLAGRVVDILADEGDMVRAGTVLARMDDTELQARLRGAQAEVAQAVKAEAQAEATLAQRESERVLAKLEFGRALFLHQKGYFTTERLDQRRSTLDVAEASANAARASLDAAKAAIDTAEAAVAQLESQIGDTVLKAPRSGRVQYKLAQPGEVLAAGAAVLTLLDLTDVYMTIFLPASAAGPLALGSEARLVLDPVPQYVIPAKVTFVAADAQFTPKEVETAEEREKLMFRIKLAIPPDLLAKYEKQVKTGVRGVGYVRVRSDAVWPDSLAVKLPQ
jgi:HlyD family secretion protein